MEFWWQWNIKDFIFDSGELSLYFLYMFYDRCFLCVGFWSCHENFRSTDSRRKELLTVAENLHLSALALSQEAFGEKNVQTAKHYGNLGR